VVLRQDIAAVLRDYGVAHYIPLVEALEKVARAGWDDLLEARYALHQADPPVGLREAAERAVVTEVWEAARERRLGLVEAPRVSWRREPIEDPVYPRRVLTVCLAQAKARRLLEPDA